MDRKSDRPAETTAAAIADKVTTGACSGLTDCTSSGQYNILFQKSITIPSIGPVRYLATVVYFVEAACPLRISILPYFKKKKDKCKKG
ncbi:hypothetical protein Y032_0413g1001 [Ancylostoma ceylanicum]|uniref:Uncharacterized protein n=1 Tax=Ancylostoma ceylanicum TaxID=53326 RepID=A0A016X1F9_9BILA|nr:hypothetical protein Y032_0413g1001 [Ancylostoma ceylanicum]